MKSLFSLMLCLMLCLPFAVPGTADMTEGDFMYYIDETIGGAALTGYSGSEANVIIPDTLGGYPLRSVSFGSFSSNASIVSVTLPASVQYMDGGAFAGCSGLTTVYLPENLIEFSNSGDSGFNYLVDKDSATAKLMINAAGEFPGNRFIDPEYPDLKLYYTADSATGAPLLGLYAYYGSSETLSVPDFIHAVYDSPLAYNTPLKFIYLPENLIEFFSLGNSSAVFYVDKDSATAKLMVNAAGAYPSKRFSDPSSPDFVFYYTADSSSGSPQLSLYKYLAADDESITIPSGVTHIYDYAFDLQDASQNTVLKEIRLPDSVVSIGSFAFPAYALPSLEAVYLSDNISVWGDYPFNGQFSLRLYCSLDSTTARTFPANGTGTSGFIDPADPDFAWKIDSSGGLILARYYGSAASLTIPDGVTAIGDNAFSSNTTLTSITVPDSVTSIGMYAFFFDSPLAQNPQGKRSIYLPDHITSVGANLVDAGKTNLFVNHDSATAKELKRLNEEWGWGVLYPFYDPQYPDYLLGQLENETYFLGYHGGNINICIPPICTSVHSNLYANTPDWNNIRSVAIAEGVTRIEDRAFDGGWSFEFLSLPSTLRYIGSYALFATGVRTLIIPEGVTEVGEVVVDSALDHLVLPASLTTIPENAFARNGAKVTNVGTVYCYRGSCAETWAKARPYQKIKYIEDIGYSFAFPDEPHTYTGSSYDWRSNTSIFPAVPDVSYTLGIESANPDIVSVENDELILKKPGVATMTVSCPELGISGSFKLTVYASIEDFSIPEYVFTKVGTKNLTISASDIVPASGTDPQFMWNLTGAHSGHRVTRESFVMDAQILPAEPDVCTVTATTRNSKLTRTGRLVVYSTVNGTVFAPFTGRTAAGMTVQPDITVTVDGIDYKNIPAAYTLTSANTKVAKPTADGRLELLAPGTATITAKFLNGTTAKQTITVADERIYAIPAGVKEIGREAFVSCPATIVTIPDSCVSIGERAFADCASLYVIEIPKSVSFIAEDAFDGCDDLTIVSPAGSYAETYAKAHGLAAGEE